MKRNIGYVRECGYGMKGFNVVVWDDGWVKMCDYDHDKEEWVICVFDTEKEAQEALDRYNECWF